jgi:hypothetical protein
MVLALAGDSTMTRFLGIWVLLNMGMYDLIAYLFEVDPIASA